MYRLTTPIHQFIIDINPLEWTKYIITYAQRDTVLLEKTENDNCGIEEIEDDLGNVQYMITVKLSQEETKLFSVNDRASVQIRCQYENGDTFASDIIYFKIDDTLNKTVI